MIVFTLSEQKIFIFSSLVGNMTTNSSITKVSQPMKAPPEIQRALDGEDKWAFNIINLEKVTNLR